MTKAFILIITCNWRHHFRDKQNNSHRCKPQFAQIFRNTFCDAEMFPDINNLLSFDTIQSIINMLIMVMLLNIFSGTYRSRYYAPDVLKQKKWKWFGIRQIGQMPVTLDLFQNSYGVTFCVKFDAISYSSCKQLARIYLMRERLLW